MLLSFLNRFIVLMLAGGLIASCSAYKAPYQTDDQFLTNVTVIDVTDGSEKRGQTLVIRNDKIFEISPADQVKPPSPEQVLVNGGYVVPGLWDMHVHSLSDADAALDYFFPLFIANGVTGIRDMGSMVEGIVDTRARLAQDTSIPAPHLYVSGPLLDGQKLRWYGDLQQVIQSVEDVNQELSALQAAGMDFFKVYSSLKPDVYQAIIAFGKENNIPVAGHAPKTVDFTGAVLAGQRTIEHISPFGFRDCLSKPDMWFSRSINAKFRQGPQAYYEVTQELFDAIDRAACQKVFETMAASGTVFTPTLALELNDRSRVPAEDLIYGQPGWGKQSCQRMLAGLDGVDPVLREAVYKEYGKLVNQMRTAGVTMIAGSDLSNNCLLPGFGLHWELERHVEVGFTPLEALQNATIHAVNVMDRGDEYGQVKTGYYADLLVLKANPLDDVSHLRRIKGVMSQGRWVNGQDRIAMMKAVREDLADQEKSMTPVE